MDKILAELLDDAILVASYGQRAGCLDDTALFAAIQQAKAVPNLGWHSPEIVDLQVALSAAVARIHPVTLVDLRGGWNPFRDGGHPGTRGGIVGKIAFVLLAIFLVFLSGYYTVWHKRATLLLNDLAAVRSEEQSAIINEVFFRLIEANDESLRDDLIAPGSLSHVTIREKIDQLRALDKRLAENARKYNELTVSLVPLRHFYWRALSLLYPPPAELPQGKFVAVSAGGEVAGGSPEADKLAQFAGPATPARVSGCYSLEATERTLIAAEGAHDPVTWLKTYVRSQDTLLGQIRCIIGLHEGSVPGLFDYREAAAADLTQKIDVLGLWVLPGLYGALGAVMFFMRASLNPLHPDPNVMRVLLRVSLGIFAGISIAWFWSPTFIEGLGVADISLGVLTIAFLFGFGIDVFFSLLDRLVTLANGAINRLGTPT